MLNPTPKPDARDIEKEKQAIYSFFLGSGGGPTASLQDTATDISKDDPQQTIDHIRSRLPSHSKATLDNFMERNAQPSQLLPDMQLDGEYVLLGEEDQQKIFRQSDGWDAFYKQYPGSGGYTVVPRVGFNNTLDQALIYVGNIAGPLMGAGYYYLLEKKGDEWRILEQIMVWIS